MTTVITPTAKRPLYQKIMVVAAMLTIIGGTLTGIMTYINIGYSDTFFSTWFSSFVLATLVTMPVGLVSMMLIGKFVERVMPNAKKIIQQVVTAFSMAVVMESVMAVTTAANIVGFSDKAVFAEAWSQGFLAAIPVGIVISLVMTMFLKDKLAAFMAS